MLLKFDSMFKRAKILRLENYEAQILPLDFGQQATFLD